MRVTGAGLLAAELRMVAVPAENTRIVVARQVSIENIVTDGGKLVWALVMLVLPVVGVIAYAIVRPPAAGDVHGIVGANERPSEQARDRHPV